MSFFYQIKRLNFKKNNLSSIIIVFCMCMVGCSSSIKYKQLTLNDFCILKTGVTKKEEVIQYLGLPNKIIKTGKNGLENEIWTYLKNSVVNKSGYTPSVTYIDANNGTAIFLHSQDIHYNLNLDKEEVLALLLFDSSDLLINIK